MTQAHLADGTILDFPDGTDDAVVDRVVKQHMSGGQAAQTTPENQDTSLPRTVFDQVGQGLTFNLMDEGQDAIGALGAKAYDMASGENNLPSLTETLKQARQGTQDRLDQQMQERPVTSIASNLAGSLITGGALTSTKAGQAVTDSLRNGSRAIRAAKGAVTGAVAGGASGFGAGKDELADRVQSTGRGALLGAVAGAASNAISPAGGSVSKTTPNSDQLRKDAGKLYQSATQNGGVLNSQFTDKFIDEVDALKPQTAAGKLLSGDSPFTQIVDKMQGLRGKEITLDEAQEIDEFLGDAIDSFTDLGRVNKQGKKLLDIQSTFRDMIDNAGHADLTGGRSGFDALKQGRAMWSDSRKLSDIEKILTRADMTDNPATSIKNGFRTLYNNPNRMRGFNQAQKAAIKKAAESGVVSDTLRTVLGSRLIAGLAGNAAGGLGGAAAATASSIAARGAAETLQTSRAQKVAELIAGKYAKTNTTQPALSSLMSYLPQTAGIASASTAQKIAEEMLRNK